MLIEDFVDNFIGIHCVMGIHVTLILFDLCEQRHVNKFVLDVESSHVVSKGVLI